jgi:hypothetical protein
MCLSLYDNGWQDSHVSIAYEVRKRLFVRHSKMHHFTKTGWEQTLEKLSKEAFSYRAHTMDTASCSLRH